MKMIDGEKEPEQILREVFDLLAQYEECKVKILRLRTIFQKGAGGELEEGEDDEDD